MNIDDIRHVLVVGAGTMGRQIALRCALQGYEVTVYDVSPEALRAAAEKVKASAAAQLVDQQRSTRPQSDAALSRINFTSKPENAAKADLLSESVPEDPDLKAKIFAQFNKLCPPRTIFTTNTSTLLPSMFADATGRPAQFAALHFHNVWDANLVDIMPHPGTSPETVELLRAFAKRIGQIPLVLKKESAKYVYNAFAEAINSTALGLLSHGVASVEDIDRAFMIVTKARMGPFGGMDSVGLDTMWHVMDSAARINHDARAQAFADQFKKDYIDKGWLGAKTGRGFYTYPDPAYERRGFLTGEE